jgi:hypothetical protein
MYTTHTHKHAHKHTHTHTHKATYRHTHAFVHAYVHLKKKQPLYPLSINIEFTDVTVREAK